MSDLSGFLVGHIWTCRTYLAILSNITWICRTYLASDKSDFVGHIEPSQGLLYMKIKVRTIVLPIWRRTLMFDVWQWTETAVCCYLLRIYIWCEGISVKLCHWTLRTAVCMFGSVALALNLVPVLPPPCICCIKPCSQRRIRLST